MYPILYDSITAGVVPDNYGVGVLTDTISCSVTEERNGQYELTLRYPSSGKYASSIVPRAILKVKPNFTDDPQLFRIYKVGKEIGSSFTINARHISYDMSGFPITSGTATNCAAACALLTSKAEGFNITTDKGVEADFEITEPSSVRSWFGGKTGSLLDVYGKADWHYDNFSAKLLAHRGSDRGVTIRYGKNLTKMTNTDDASNLATGVMAYWKPTEGEDGTTEGELVVSSIIDTGITLDITAVTVIDASADFETQPTAEDLNSYVTKYINNHELTTIENNITFDFAQISKLLKDRVDLCDTVHIVYEDYNINADATCITTIWDVLQEKYTSITLGTPKTNIADTIVSINKAVTGPTLSQAQIQNAINASTKLITGNKGGYVVMHDSDGDGFPDELLIMNTASIDTATKVWRWNLGGLGYSNTGYDGSYGTAITMDGSIVADYVKTGNLVFGGTEGNTDGKLEIQDADGNQIAIFNKAGCYIYGGVEATSFKAYSTDKNMYIILSTDYAKSSTEIFSGLMIYEDNDPNIYLGHITKTYYDQTVGNSHGLHIEGHDNTISVSEDLDVHVGKTQVETSAGTTGNQQASTIEGTTEASSTTAGRSSYSLGSAMNDFVKSTPTGSATLQLTRANNTAKLYCQDNYDHDSDDYPDPHWGSALVMHDSDNNNRYLIVSPNELSFFTQKSSSSGTSYPATLTYYEPTGIIVMGDGTDVNIKLYLNTGNITCVSLTQTSSEKYKKNIEDLSEDEAKKILQLRPVNYDFIDPNKGTNMHGFIAEEVDEVIPDLVRHTSKYEETEEDEVSLDYTMMIPYLTKMIQMQQEQIDNLQKQIDELKGE